MYDAASVDDAVIRYFRVDRHDLVYLKFILEAYEGMSTLSTFDNSAGIVRLVIPAAFAADLTKLVDALCSEIRLVELSRHEEHAHHA